MKYTLQNTAVAKQWTTKWPYIANVVQNHGEKSYFCRS